MKSLKFAILACALTLVANGASALTYSFTKITNNGNPNVAGQLTVDVLDGGIVLGVQSVDFKFYNAVGTASSITDIYFDDGTLLAIASITDSGNGPIFISPANPGNLPGGNAANPAFNTTGAFSADSASPVSQNGVNASGEWVNIRFTLQGSQTYADTIAALADGSLRIGLHVQAIGTPGGSDSYVNGPVVPEPGSVGVFSIGLLVAGGLIRRFGRKA